MVCHRFPTANFREVFLGCSHGPAESESKLAFDFPCDESGGCGVHVHAQGAQVRCQIPTTQTSVERSDSANFWIVKGSDDLLKIVRFHTHVTVTHDKEI